MRRVRKFFAVPEIATGLVQNAHRHMRVEIEGRRLVVLSVDDDDIARMILVIDGHRQIVR